MKEWALYSWKDIDRALKTRIEEFQSLNCSIEVYPDSIDVVSDKLTTNPTILQIFEDLFEDNYNKTNNTIQLDNLNTQIPINIENTDTSFISTLKYDAPLFKDSVYKQSLSYSKDVCDSQLSVPVLAFHSYKGGVGRTLSLLAFAKAWSQVNSDKKLLIIDSDYEAPGLTFLFDGNKQYSLIDLIQEIQNSTDLEKSVELISPLVRQCTMTIQTSEMDCDHFFIPTYRYYEQLLDMYANPITLSSDINTRFILSEFLSKLAVKVGAEAVLIDLRAGLSDLSAPLVFDPRVKKIIVSSTSLQSVKGTEFLVKQILKENLQDIYPVPEIWLTMIQQDDRRGVDTAVSLFNDIIKDYDDENGDNKLTNNFVIELPFSEELVNLGDLQNICERLNNRDLYKTIVDYVKQNYSTNSGVITKDNRKVVLEKIHDITSKQITAEGSSDLKMLLTSSITSLVNSFDSTVPNVVIMGAKGSGKTFLFREICKNVYWEAFLNTSSSGTLENKSVLFPIISSENSFNFDEQLQLCLNEYSSIVDDGKILDLTWHSNKRDSIKDYMKESHDELSWKKFWVDFLKPEDYETMALFNESLKNKDRKVVYLIDGLEELFINTSDNSSQKSAIKSLVVDVVNEIRRSYSNIGIICFLRNDLGRNSIVVNYEQFKSLYKSYELKWSSTEALRLALWLVKQADSCFYDKSFPIEKASEEIIRESLVKLWGLKLGRPNSNEAISSNWIIAALSDFNGQLQARDIVRFLSFATENSDQESYDDRFIMPTEIRNAVPTCSSSKLTEINSEIVELKPILDKLKQTSEDKKVLPFSESDIELTSSEQQKLISYGYLIVDNYSYYLPEILRFALGFKYNKGARPKVLSLMNKRNKK